VRPARRHVLLTALAGAVLLGCGPADGTEVAVVEIVGHRFEPTTIVVTAGTTVRWVNSTTEAHTVTSGPQTPDGEVALPPGAQGFDSGRLLGGASFAHRFDVVGEYFYWCALHPDEHSVGTVRVEGG